MTSPVLRENGTAVDAAITTALCVGVVNSFSSGIGGGGFMVIRPPSSHRHGLPATYDAIRNPLCAHPISIDFRETAPLASHPDMFTAAARPDDPSWDPNRASKVGGLAVGVPGELRGFQAAYEACGGGVSWERIFRPVAQLAREFRVGKELHRRLNARWTGGDSGPTISEWMKDEEDWRAMFMRPGGDEFLQEGDIVRREAYGRTLEKLGKEGADVFYEGDIADRIVETVRKQGGILTKDDMRSYKAVVRRAEEGTYRGRKYYTGSYPSGGPIIRMLLNVLDGYADFVDGGQTGLSEHRFIEALKCACSILRLICARASYPDLAPAQSPSPRARTSEILRSSTTPLSLPRFRLASTRMLFVATSPTCVACLLLLCCEAGLTSRSTRRTALTSSPTTTLASTSRRTTARPISPSSTSGAALSPSPRPSTSSSARA